MFEAVVHPHALRHGILEEDILYAWENFIVKRWHAAPRKDEAVAIGTTKDGMLIQMVGRELGSAMLIFHAMTPPSEKAMREFGLRRRER